MPRFAALPLILIFAGCAGVSLSPGAHVEEIRAAPEDVVLAAVEVFEDENIPVSDYRPGIGTVTSSTFDPRKRWGDAGVAGRIVCGVDRHGDRRTVRGTITFEVDLEAESSRRRSSEPINLWSTVRLRGRGSVSDDEGGSQPCSLTADYRDRLFRLIRRRAERYTG